MTRLSSVALMALAVGLATPATAQQQPAADPVSAAAVEFPLTPQGAADFVAAAEADLFDYSVDASRIAWVNATYITDDTDLLAARSGAIGTEKSVRYALEAARYAEVPGLDPELARKLVMLRTGIVLPAPTSPGAATELSTIAT